MAQGFVIARAWRACRAWLRNVPVADDVDRRNAPALQVVLLMLVVLPSAAWFYRVFFSHLPWRDGEMTSMLGSLGLCVLSGLCVVLVRRGRFQLALRLLLGVIAVLMMDSYARQGMASNLYELPVQVAWLVVAGLMAGRRALWALYAWMVLAFVAGTLTDVRLGKLPDPWQALASYGVVSALMFLFIVVVVDRSTVALRESLAAARARGDELAAAKTRLEAEIAERERLHGQLVHSQKVEAAGRLAAGVAHDFNHLLNLVLGYAARASGTDDDAQRSEALAGVESAARRATAVSRKLTTFAHRGTAVAETFDVNTALSEMQPMLRQLFGPGVVIAFEPAAQAQVVCMDRGEFELVVLNLAANANDAMPDGGRFGIVVQAQPGRVRLSFSDSGVGMDEAVRSRIFEPFFTTRANGQGSGLGLAVASDVVTLSGGSLGVDSAPGRGTTFQLELPLIDAAADEADSAALAAAGTP